MHSQLRSVKPSPGKDASGGLMCLTHINPPLEWRCGWGGGSAGPGNLDGVLRRRVARDDVLRRLAVAEVLEDVRLARRHVDHVAGADLDLLLEVVAPLDAQAAGEHV